MTGPDAPRPVQSVTRTTVGGSVFQVGGDLTYVVAGPAIGDGLYRWPDWVRRAAAGELASTGDAVTACTGSRAISRGLEDGVLREVDEWLRGPHFRPGALVLGGKHGTGLTWLLFRIAHRLADGGHGDRLYVADDPERLAVADLSATLAGAGPVVLFIDDADRQQALGLVARLLRTNTPVLAVLGYTDVKQFADVSGRRSRNRSFALPDVPTEDERNELREVFRHRHLTLSERPVLHRGNLRSIARLLGSRMTTAEVADRLARLKDGDDHTPPLVSDAVALLVFTTMYDAHLPQSLLLRCLGGQVLPGEVLSWVSTRWIRDLDDREHPPNRDKLIWVEDRVAAAEAQRLWRNRNALDHSSYEDHVVGLAIRLLRHVEPRRSAHRFFARTLVAALPRRYRRAVAAQIPDTLLAIAEAELLPQFVFSWYPLLSRSGVDADDLLERHANAGRLSVGGPVDLLLMLHYVGDEESAQLLAAKLEFSAAWSVRRWADFVALLEHVTEARAGALTRLALPFLRGSGMDLEEVLRQSNTAQLVVPLVERYADPADRLWVWGAVRRVVRSRPHATEPFTRLTERCTTQPRSELALGLLSDVGNGRYDGIPEAAAHYRAVYDNELTDALGEQATGELVDVVRSLAAQPNIANNVWSVLLRFSQIWTPAQAPGLTWEAWDYCGSLRADGVRLKVLAATLNAALHSSVRFGHLRSADALVALEPFRWRSGDVKIARSFIVLAAAVAASSGPAVEAARGAIAALEELKGAALRAALSDFLSMTATWAGSTRPYHAPSPLFELDYSSRAELVHELIPRLRLAPPADPAARAHRLMRRWGKVSEVRPRLLYEFLRLDQSALCLDLVRPGLLTSPTGLCNRAAVLARQGRLADARDDLAEVVRIYRGDRRGAHPHAVNRATTELIAATRGPERDGLLLARALITLGPLQEIGQVLQPHEAEPAA